MGIEMDGLELAFFWLSRAWLEGRIETMDLDIPEHARSFGIAYTADDSGRGYYCMFGREETWESYGSPMRSRKRLMIPEDGLSAGDFADACDIDPGHKSQFANDVFPRLELIKDAGFGTAADLSKAWTVGVTAYNALCDLAESYLTTRRELLIA
jgi:hypothetical protein